MQKRRTERNFLEEKLRIVRKALLQLKEDKEIEWFLRSGSESFARRKRVDFYAVYLDGQKHIGRPLWIVRDGEEIENKKSAVRVSPFESEGSLRTKILQVIKRF